MHCLALMSIAVCAAVLCTPQDVRGQTDLPPTEQRPPGYDDAIDLAIQEFETGNYEEARSRFLEAHAIWPNARTLRALGKVEYELKHYRAAIAYLEDALASTVRPLSAPSRADTQRLLRQARAYVAHYMITTSPPDARISVDGEQVVRTPDNRITLDVGMHTLEVQAPGYVPRRRELQVLGGVDQVLQVELRPLPSEPVRSAERRSERVHRKAWIWTGVVGAVAAGVATGLAIGLRRDAGERDPSGGTTGLVVNVPPPRNGDR